MVRDPPANARDTVLTPGSRRFDTPQSSEAHTPQLLKPTPSRDCAPQWEATAKRSLLTTAKTGSHAPQLEKACASNKDPGQPKKLINKIIF